MRIARNCEVCKKQFIAIKETQLYCERKCFKRSYYLRNKAKLDAEKAMPNFPKKTCAYCSVVQTIPYDPIEQPQRFNEWECINCGVTNKLIWKHQNNPQSYQVITNILQSLRVHSFLLTKPAEYTVRASFMTIVTEEPPKANRHDVEPSATKTRRVFESTVAM